MLLLTEKTEDRGLLIQATKSSTLNISSVIFILLKHAQETESHIYFTNYTMGPELWPFLFLPEVSN